MPRYKAIVGVDSQFFNLLMRDMNRDTKFPYEKFMAFLEDSGFEIIEIFAPVVRFPARSQDPEEVAKSHSKFVSVFHALQEIGVNAIEAPAKYVRDTDEIKHSDDQRLMIKLAVTCTRLRPDFLFLVAADGDYAPLVWELREQGIRTKLITHDKILAGELRRAVNSTTDLIGLLDDFGHGHRPPRRSFRSHIQPPSPEEPPAPYLDQDTPGAETT